MYWRSTGAGSGTKTFTGGLEAQKNFQKTQSFAVSICHVLRNSKKIFRFIDFTAAAHVTMTTAKKYLFEICEVKTWRFYKKPIGSLKSTFATQNISKFTKFNKLFWLLKSPVADPDLQGRWGGGGGHPDWDRGRGALKKIFFSALRTSVWSKNKGGPGTPGPSPGSATGLGPCKGIQDNLGFWIPRRGFWIPDSLSVELASGFNSLAWIFSLSCTPDSKAQDSGFQTQKFPVFPSPGQVL